MGETSEDELREAYRDPGLQGEPEPGEPEPELSYFPEGKRRSGPAFAQPLAMDLNALLDVYLDTKTIRRVQEGPSIIPAVALLNQTVGSEQDTARIALECEGETYFLTEERLSHLDSNEWFSKIRRFLRRHGWVPEDERVTD